MNEEHKFDFQNFKIRISQFVPLIAAGFLLFLLVSYWSWIEVFFSLLVAALKPIIIGLVIAYIVNILMVAYERLLGKTRLRERPGIQKTISLCAALITIIAAIILIISLVLPQFIKCIGTLVQKAPTAIENFISMDVVAEHLPDSTEELLESINWTDLVSRVQSVLQSGLLTGVNQVIGGFSLIVTIVLSVIFAIYMLTGKERLLSQLNRFGKCYTSPKIYGLLCNFCHRLNQSFHNYVVGQCTEAVILGMLCAIGMLILRLPYATMIGALVGTCALIPVAGAYIGAVVGVVMIASVSLPQSLMFLIFLIILQQIEGNVIYPKVVGASVGLSGIWVLSAVTVFGALMGIPGMFIGVPVTSTIYQILREDLHRREKQIPEK